MIAWLEARAWQVGAIGAGAAAVALTITLGVTTLQRNAAVRDRDALHAQIHAPVTGYIATAARCEANARELDGSLTRQNAAVEVLRRDGAARIAAAEQRLAAAQRTAADARLRADRLLNIPLTSAARCDRIEEADARVTEALR